MRKFLITILSCVLLVMAVCFFGCGCNKTKWSAPEFNDKNVTTAEGGFVAETDNYVLFINGVADHTDDNTYKNAVKGSLMVIAKEDLASGEYGKANVLIPKLFASTDYNAGIYVYDDYVYFGTPSTDKNARGSIANDTMVIAKAKINGTEKPASLITLPSLSCEYRVVKSGDTVYVVFHDTRENALKVLNTNSGSVSVIAKADDKTNTGNGEYLSLDTYKFTDNGDESVLFFTAKVYTEKYYEEKASKSNYSRLTASYNYVYSYKVGDGAVDSVFLGEKILGCEDKEYSYTLNLVDAGYLFFDKAERFDKEAITHFAFDIENETEIEIINADAVADTSLIIGLDEVYVLDSNGYLVKKSLIGEIRDSKINVIKKGNMATLLFLDENDNMYYYDSAKQLYTKNISDDENKEIKISDDTVNDSWYAPELIEVNDKAFIFYADSTTAGSNYVFVADLSKNYVEEDTNDDDVADTFYYENDFIGKVKDADFAKDFYSEVNKLGSTIKFTEDEDGKLYNENLKNAKAIYDSFSKNQKKKLDGAYVSKYENALNAEKLANAYYPLKGVQKYNDLTEDEKAEKKYGEKFETAKNVRNEIINSDKDGANYTTARDLLEAELKYYYQEASKIFG